MGGGVFEKLIATALDLKTPSRSLIFHQVQGQDIYILQKLMRPIQNMKTCIRISLLSLLVSAANAQFYSETIRSNQQTTAGEESLFLPAPPPQAPTSVPNPRINLPTATDPLVLDDVPLGNIELVPNDWQYQPEPYVDNLPPHLTRFLGMLLYYSNGSAYIVYTNTDALHHQKGLRTGDRVLSINGKSVSFYKERFIEQLNEIRQQRDMHLHCLMGTPAQQRILIIPNLYKKDEKLDQLCLKAGLGDAGMWDIASGKIPTLRTAPPPPPEKPAPQPSRRNYRQSRRQIFAPILNQQQYNVTQQNQASNKQLVELFGMLLSYEGGRLLVLKVKSGSAAENANITQGDEIVQINDQPTRSLDYNLIKQLSSKNSLILGWTSKRTGRSKIGNFHSHQRPPNS